MTQRRNRDTAGRYKPQQHDGERRRPTRRTPEEVEAARERMRVEREAMERIGERMRLQYEASRERAGF